MSKSIKVSSPKRLKPFFEEHHRYKGLKGGRGSGKSYAAADYFLFQLYADQNRDALCLREIQKSIKNSSKKLLEDRIDHYDLWDHFEVFQTEIRCKRGRGFIAFQGLQDHTADSVKSMEAFSLVWIEEAQTISQHSLDLLLPTIREEGSELLFTWNSRHQTDPVEKLFKNAKDSLLIHINYTDNPFCPNVLIAEAEEMRAYDADKYHHVYLGGFIDTSDNKLFSYKDLDRAMNRHGTATGATVVGVDVARFGDDSSCVCVRSGLWVKVILTKKKADIVAVADWAKGIANVYEADALIVDTIGLGVGVHDHLIRAGYFSVDGNFSKKAAKEVIYHNKRAESYFALSDAMKRGLSIPEDDELVEELLSVEYEFTATGRVKIIEKEKIKENLGRSPDKADALALTYFTDVLAIEARDKIDRHIVNNNVF